MISQELLDAQRRPGIFAIVSTRDLQPEEVLPEYYLRQSIEQSLEQYFDYGKNYPKFLPVRQQNMQTLSGHLLLAFIASFFITVIKNRLNILDVQYVALPQRNSNKDLSKNSDELIIEQDPLLSIFKESPATLFSVLRGQKADIFKSCIISAIPLQSGNDFYSAFGLKSPLRILRNGDKLNLEFDKKGNEINKNLVFAQRPCVTDEEIKKNVLRNRNKISRHKSYVIQMKGLLCMVQT